MHTLHAKCCPMLSGWLIIRVDFLMYLGGLISLTALTGLEWSEVSEWFDCLVGLISLTGLTGLARS